MSYLKMNYHGRHLESICVFEATIWKSIRCHDACFLTRFMADIAVTKFNVWSHKSKEPRSC